MNRRLLGGCALALSAAGAQAAPGTDTDGLGASLMVAGDSEGFATRRTALGYLPAYGGRDAHTGIKLGASRFSQDGWRRDAAQIGVVHRALDPATMEGVQIEAGLSRQGGRELLVLDAGHRRALAARTSAELFLSRDWVETRRALDEGVHVNFGGVALEQGIGEHLTLVGVAGYQDFSDGNARRHGRVRLIYQPSLELGLTLQARYRAWRGEPGGPARSYFNPERYQERMLAVGWRQRIAGWMGSVTAGGGRQRVGDGDSSATRLLEAALDSPPGAVHALRLRAGYNRSASFGGPDYAYRYLQAELHLRF